MDIDDCFSKVVGNFGKYQILIICIELIYGVCTAGLILLMAFVGEDPDKLKHNNFQVRNDSSILAEWNLLDEEWVSDVIQALFFGGFLIGVIMFGQLSDRYGRRSVMIIGFSMLFPGCLLSSISVSLSMFGILRFFTGLVCGGVTLVQFIYLQEIVGQVWWATTGTTQNLMFQIGIFFLVIGAYYFPHWRQLIRFLTWFQIPPLIFVMFIPESPRWLYSKGQVNKAEKVLTLIARRNGVVNPVCTLKALDMESPKRTYNPIHIFQYSITRKRILVMSFIWFVNGFVYYALTSAAGKIGSNTYSSEALSVAVEIPCILLSPILINRQWCGRKYGTAVALLLAGFSCFLLIAFDPKVDMIGKMIFGLSGKLAIIFSINIVYVYSCELFPTCIRNVALGCLSMFACIGGIASSFSKSLIINHSIITYCFFGACGITAGLLTFLLPETLSRKPPNVFEDLEQPKLRSNFNASMGFLPLDSSRFRNRSTSEYDGLLNDAVDEEEDTPL